MDVIVRQLEIRIKALLRRCEQLEQTNQHLKQSKYLLQSEKDALLAKNKIAIAQIEKMVSRLKSIE